MQMTRQLLTIKPSPSVSIKSTKFYDGRTPALLLSILSNTLAADLEKSESGSSYTSSSTSSIAFLFSVFHLYDEGILPVTHQTQTAGFWRGAWRQRTKRWDVFP